MASITLHPPITQHEAEQATSTGLRLFGATGPGFESHLTTSVAHAQSPRPAWSNYFSLTGHFIIS